MSQTRRLAAILAVDVVGYSRLIAGDEGSTLQAFKAIRAELLDPTIAAHNGRIVKTTGNGLLVEFSSVMDALRCATEVQTRNGRAKCFGGERARPSSNAERHLEDRNVNSKAFAVAQG
jgi:class 3 adenylate cyclase